MMTPTHRLAARRLAYCAGCCDGVEEQTVQWLVGVDTGSPGSYLGTRVWPIYRCTECGRTDL